MDNTLRSAHHLLLELDRFGDPKEAFKAVVSLAEQSGLLHPGCQVSDFGCGAGEFLYYLKKVHPSIDATGFDIEQPLLDRAKIIVKDVDFKIGSVLNSEAAKKEEYDISFFLGTISIFESFIEPIDNLISWTKKGGKIYIHSFFNPYPADVWIKYRLPDHQDQGMWGGLNNFSIASVSTYLEEKVGAGRYRFIPFTMPFELAPDSTNVWRTWTFQDAEGNRLFTNGLCMLQYQFILEIDV